MPDPLLPATSPTLTTWRRRLSAWLWGYDYFVSYHWASGGAYAVALAGKLRDRGYDVFLDRAEYAMGDDWKGVGERALRNTQRLVLVATREAVTQSAPVAHEVRVFTARSRQIIPIVFTDGPADSGASILAGLDRQQYPVLGLIPDSQLYIKDDAANLPRGPNGEVVDQLIRTFRVMRRRNIRATLMGIAAAVLIGFTAVALISWGNAELRRADAEQARDDEKAAAKRESEAKNAVRKRLESQYVKAGARHLREGDHAGAMLWFTEAAALNPEDPIHRVRLALAVRECPTLLHAWRHEGEVHVAVFSPDGKRVLTAGADGRARVWDATAGAPASPWLAAAEGSVYQAAFSPDGRRVLTVGFPTTQELQGQLIRHVEGEPLGQITVWTADTGERLATVRDARAAVQKAYFTPDGRHIVSVGKGVMFWDAATGALVGTPLCEGGNVVFSQDGSLVAVVPEMGGTVKVFDTVTKKLLYPALTHGGDLSMINQVAFSHDSRKIYTGGKDQTLRSWDARTGQPLRTLFKFDGEVYAVSLSPDGRRLVAAGRGKFGTFEKGAVVVLDPDRERDFEVIDKRQSIMTGAALSPDNQSLVMVYRGVDAADHPIPAVAELRRPDRYTRDVRFLFGVRSARYSPDGGRLLTTYGDHSVRLWGLRTPLGGEVARVHPIAPKDSYLSPDGRRVLTDYGEGFRLWDSANGRDVAPPLPKGASFFSDNGTHVVTFLTEPDDPRTIIQVRNADTGELVGPPIVVPTSPSSLDSLPWALAPNGRLFARAGPGGSLGIWRTDTGAQVDTIAGRAVANTGAVLADFDRSIKSLLFRPDGNQLTVLDQGGRVAVWGSTTGLLSGSGPNFGRGVEVHGVRYSPDGTRLVVIADGSRVRVWDLTERRFVGDEIRPPGGGLFQMIEARFSPDGRRVLTFGGSPLTDSLAQFWDASTGHPVSEPMKSARHNGGSMEYNSNGRMLLSAGGAGSFDLWDAATGFPVALAVRVGDGIRAAEFDATGGDVVVLAISGGPLLEPDLRIVRIGVGPAQGSIDSHRSLARILSNRWIDETDTLVTLDRGRFDEARAAVSDGPHVQTRP